MFSGPGTRTWVIGCILVACAGSSAPGQMNNPPSGAVPNGAARSHYATGVNTAAEVHSPHYQPIRQLGPVAPVVHEQIEPLAPRDLAHPVAAPAPLALAPRGTTSGKALIRTPTAGYGALSSVAASLGLVVAAFLCVAWLSKRYLPKTAGPLPKEVVEQLGWAPLAGRQQMQLVRLGNKLLLLAVTPGSSVEPLTEVTEPAEVERLSALCRRTKQDSTTHSFREVISALEREPVRGFVESAPRATVTARPTTGSTSGTPMQARPLTGRTLHG